MLAAIILAAGKSTRMGEPKALVRFRKKSFLETIVENFKNAGIENVLTVLGHAATDISKELNLSSKNFVVNSNYQLGQFSSFQTGVRNLPSEAVGTFLVLVDQPQIDTKLIKEIQAAFLGHSEQIVIPTCKGKRGHPPIFPRAFFPEILGMASSQTAADFIHRHADDIFEVEVGNERILWNINTKQDLHRLRNTV